MFESCGMQPKGFWSYARGDDDHLEKMLSDLRRQIAGEVSLLMGHDIGIFQDIHDLRTGDRWADKLRAELNAASFLIPVLTPRFFNRPWCREEVLTYLRLSHEAGLEPRIFPVRFVEWDDDPACEVRAALQPFQYKDFSRWRFESDPTQKSRLENAFAKDVKARLKLPPRAVPAVTPQEAFQRDVEFSGTAAKERPAPQDPTAPSRTVHIVDRRATQGGFVSIQAAIDAARPGDKIIVREGTYRESLRLSDVMEIVGEGDAERILVTSNEGDTLHVDAPMARVSGIRFRREDGGRDCAVWITSGAAFFQDCIMESRSLSAVSVSGPSTSAEFRRCIFRHSPQEGLAVVRAASVAAYECISLGNGYSGFGLKGTGTKGTFQRCAARNNAQSGFFFLEGSKGHLHECMIEGNKYAGIMTASGGDPTATDCKIRGNALSGLVVFDASRATVESSEIFGNLQAGVGVQNGGSASARGCTVTGNGYESIWIKDATSTGTFRGNDLRGNARGAWNIAKGATVIDENNSPDPPPCAPRPPGLASSP